MTVIAWDGKTLASDSRMTLESYITSDKCQKLFDIRNREVFYFGDKLLCLGVSGRISCVDLFINYITSPEFPNLPPIDPELYGIIVGKQYNYLFEGAQLIKMQKSEKLSEGSGAPFALSAMKLGLSAPESIKFAIKCDSACGGKVQVWKK